jgi:hypothetical protein
MKILMWIATVAGILGSVLLAANFGLEVYGFISFIICSGILAAYAAKKEEYSLLVLQAFHIIIDIVGLIRFY